MKVRMNIIMVLLIGLTCTMLSGCRTSKYEVEYPIITFSSIDELIKAVNDCNNNPYHYDDYVYQKNKFKEVELKYLPIIDDPHYSLYKIKINEYCVFFCFVPEGYKTFSYETGIEVAFPREDGATIDVVRKQFGATLEDDGSFYESKYNSWFIPLDDGKYYEVRFPNSLEGIPDKTMVRIEVRQ